MNVKKIFTLTILTSVFLIFAGAIMVAQADPNATFSNIQGAIVSDYDTHQVKITYLGSQDKTTPTLVFRSSARSSLDMALFVPYYRSYIFYVNDCSIWSFSAPSADIKKFIDSIAAYPQFTTTSPVSYPYLSLSISRYYPPSERVFECLIEEKDAHLLLNLLDMSISEDNVAGKDYILKYLLLVK
jgi:hypothetical protein